MIDHAKGVPMLTNLRRHRPAMIMIAIGVSIAGIWYFLFGPPKPWPIIITQQVAVGAQG